MNDEKYFSTKKKQTRLISAAIASSGNVSLSNIFFKGVRRVSRCARQEDSEMFRNLLEISRRGTRKKSGSYTEHNGRDVIFGSVIERRNIDIVAGALQVQVQSLPDKG